MLLPQLYESVVGIVDNAETIRTTTAGAINILEDNPEIQSYVDSALGKIYEFINNWITTTFLEDATKAPLTTSTSSVVAFVKGFMNFLIGFVASIYILWSKETFQAQSKKIIVALLSPKGADHVFNCRAQYLPGVQRLRHRQDRRLGHHRRSLLYRHSDPQDAVSADRHGHRRDERYPVLFGPIIGLVPCAFLICW